MTMENCSALCNVSPPLPRESICSWISRISLSQGVSITAMLEFLEVKLHIDFDFRFWRLDIESISKKTGLSISDFKNQRTFSKSLRLYTYYSNYYVMRYERRRRSRFCPLCLQEDEIPYFRMEWRLKLCVSCPIHDCLLEEDCHRCKNPIILPVNLFSKVSDTKPLESLANCTSCGVELTKVSPASFKGILYEAMDLKSRKFIKNGGTLIPILYKGTHRFNKDTRAMEESFSMQARNPKNKFKWTARTWRLKIKRYLKANPMVLT